MLTVSQELLDRVAGRAQVAGTRTDQAAISPTEVYPLLTSEELSQTVLELGFEPAPLYVDLMKKVGNGGFGPGYGLLGFVGGATDDMGETAVSLYKSFARTDPGDPSWNWPQGLLPICYWGCAIYSCIDCLDEQPMVKTWDPNVWEDGTSPLSAIRSTDLALADWLRKWSVGEDLFVMLEPS